MVRTQIQLTDEQANKLQKLARKRGLSKAALIRRYIDSMLAMEKPFDDSDARARAIAAVGCIHSGTGDLAARHDEYAAEAFDA